MVCVHQWELGCAQNRGLGYDNTYSSTNLPTFRQSRLYFSSSRLIVYSLSRTSEHLQPTGEDGYWPCVCWLPLVPYFFILFIIIIISIIIVYFWLLLLVFILIFIFEHPPDRKTTMAFLSGLGRTSCSPGLFRMIRAVLSILVMLVCLAHTLQVNTQVNMSGLFLLYEELQFFWIKSTITLTFLNR